MPMFLPIVFQDQTAVIAADTVWKRESNPIVISKTTIVEGGATLTIEPGVVVQFAKGAGLEIGKHTSGKLIVNGTPEAPVRFVADSGAAEPGIWSGIEVRLEGSSLTMKNAMISGAGMPSKIAPDSPRSAIMIGPRVSCSLEAVTITQCANGVEFDTEMPVSMKNCKLTNCPGFAISSSQEAAASIDESNSVSGNGIDAIMVGDVGDTQFTKPMIWSNTKIPYFIRGDLLVEGPGSEISLTLAPGVTVLLDEEATITVGWDHHADLIANGTAEKPIVFKAMKAKWDGVILGKTSAKTVFAHCRFFDGGVSEGMVVAYEGARAAIRNCRFENSETFGISIQKGAQVSMENNTFANCKSGEVDRGGQ